MKPKTLSEWLAAQRDRDSFTGELARQWLAYSGAPRRDILNHLIETDYYAPQDVARAVASYAAYLRRRANG